MDDFEKWFDKEFDGDYCKRNLKAVWEAALKSQASRCFDPSEQYGDFTYIMPSQFGDKAIDEAKELLTEISINSFVPEQFRDKMKWVIVHPNDKDAGRFRYGTVGWKIGPLKTYNKK